MPMFKTLSENAFLITPPEGAFLDPRWTADFLEGVHRQQRILALENVIRAGRLSTFVRTGPRSRIQGYLQSRFGPVQAEKKLDWLSLHWSEDAYVCTLHLNDHALLPTAGYTGREIVQRWQAILKLTRVKGEDPELTMGVRVLLRPASSTWKTDFEKRLTSGKAPGGGIASWFRASNKGGSTDIDPKRVAAKALEPAFCIEIQVIVICKAEPAEKRVAKAAFDRVTEGVVNLLGGGAIWKKAATRVSGDELFERSRDHIAVAPQELTRSYAPARSRRFVVSPREVVPLWCVRQAVPSPAPLEAPLTPPAAPKPEPVAPEVVESPAIGTVTNAPVRGDALRAESGGALNRRLAKPVRPSPTPTQPSYEKKTPFHSAQPPVTQMPQQKDLSRGKSRADLDNECASERNQTRSYVMRQLLRLTPARLTLMWWLWMMPLATTDQLVLASGLTGNQVHRGLAWLRRHGLVVRRSLAGTGRKRDRYWLTRAGVLLCAHEHNLPIWWQVTQEGITQLIDRLPMVEHCYDRALDLWRVPLARVGWRTRYDGIFLGPEHMPDHQVLHQFHWRKGKGLDAVAIFEDRSWYAIVWAGAEMTWHRLGRRAQNAMDATLAATPSDRPGRSRPAGWIIICEDELVAEHAAGWWTGDDVLVITIDGHVERVMRAVSCSTFVPDTANVRDPGAPEEAASWRKKETPVAALDHELAYRMLRFILQFRAATREQSQRKYGDRYIGAVLELIRHGYIVELEGGLYPTEKAGEAAAKIDGLKPSQVLGRLKELLKPNSDFRRDQQWHDQTLVDIHLKLAEEGITSFIGERNLRNFDGITQVRPDLVARLVGTQGATWFVNLELERSAESPGSIDPRLDNYEKVQLIISEPTPSLWVLLNEEVRRRYERAGEWLVMYTTTLDELLAGTSLGDDSVWRDGAGERAPITEIVDIMEIDILEDDE